MKFRLGGRGAFLQRRSSVVRHCGAVGRENVGMSNEKEVRILFAGSPRFPGEGSSSQGKPGPKPRSRDVGDGQSVEIPMPPYSRLKDGVTQEGRLSARLEECVQACRVDL